MNKKEFTSYIEDVLEGKTLEQQIKVLQKMQLEYLPSLIHSRQKKLGVWVPDEQKGNYMFCEKCNKYSLISKCNTEMIKEIRTETTYVDAGYGDCDMEGDVEYFVTYITCPRCAHKQEKTKLYMRTVREWNRREGRN